MSSHFHTYRITYLIQAPFQNPNSHPIPLPSIQNLKSSSSPVPSNLFSLMPLRQELSFEKNASTKNSTENPTRHEPFQIKLNGPIQRYLASSQRKSSSPPAKRNRRPSSIHEVHRRLIIREAMRTGQSAKEAKISLQINVPVRSVNRLLQNHDRVSSRKYFC